MRFFKIIATIFVAIALLATAAYYYNNTKKTIEQSDYLPEASDSGVNDDWAEFSNEEYSFNYPVDIGTSYVHLLDWPPTVQVLNEEFSCLEAGQEIDRAGRTEAVTIKGQEYCRTVVSEGAAGSIYTQYSYAFEQDDNVVILSFSTRVPQCANYDEPQALACEAEKSSVDIDDLANRVASTFTFNLGK